VVRRGSSQLGIEVERLERFVLRRGQHHRPNCPYFPRSDLAVLRVLANLKTRCSYPLHRDELCVVLQAASLARGEVADSAMTEEVVVEGPRSMRFRGPFQLGMEEEEGVDSSYATPNYAA
jgi:hypothetical protein